MDKDCLRFGSAAIYDEKSNTVGSSMYRHLECARRDQVIQLLKISKWNSNTVLKGWDSLTSDDKDTVSSKLNEIKNNEEEKKASKKGKKRGTTKKKSTGKKSSPKAKKGTKRKSKKDKEDDENDDPNEDKDNDDDDDGKKKKKKKKEKKAKDPNAPKKPQTAFFVYLREQRQVVKDKNPTMKPKELVSELGRLWKEMSDEDKKEFKDKAELEKTKYKEEVKKYEENKANGNDKKVDLDDDDEKEEKGKEKE